MRFKPLRDDISSTAFFYLDRTSAARPAPPDADNMEVNDGMSPMLGVDVTPLFKGTDITRLRP